MVASARRPPSSACARSRSGQVATAIMVAHSPESRNGRTIHRLVTSSAPSASSCSAVRASSPDGLGSASLIAASIRHRRLPAGPRIGTEVAGGPAILAGGLSAGRARRNEVPACRSGASPPPPRTGPPPRSPAPSQQREALNILGISAFYHDSAACLVRDGEIVAAAQEERFTRKKHDYRFPAQGDRVLPGRGRHRAPSSSTSSRSTTSRCSSSTACSRPTSRTRRRASGMFLMGAAALAEAEAVHAARARSRPRRRYKGRYVFLEHHESHAASAFFPSPFDEAAILTLDGVGEWATGSIAVGRGNRIEMLQGAALPALARPALLGVHLLHRLQGQQRRVQADGPGAVRRADLRRPDPREAARHARRTARSAWTCRTSPTRTGRDDVDEVRQALRRPAAHGREPDHAARDGPRRLDPGGDRGDHAAHREPRARARPGCTTCAWPAAWRSTASANGKHPARGPVRRASGSSPPRATPAARSARRCSSGTSCSTTRASRSGQRRAAGLAARPGATRTPRSRRSSTRTGAEYRFYETRTSCATRSPS